MNHPKIKTKNAENIENKQISNPPQKTAQKKKHKSRIISEKEIKRFYNHLSESEKSTNTIQKYMTDINKLKEFSKGKNISQKLILHYKNYLISSGKYKISSINSFLIVANHFFKEMGWNDLYLKTLKMQKTVFEPEEKELTKAEYRMIVQAAINSGNETIGLIMQTLASTGIRISELSYITSECLKTGVADVYNKGKLRRILLPSALRIILKKYTEKNRIQKGSIFIDSQKRPLDRKKIWYKMKKIASDAKISPQKIFPHNFRHLFAREFYNQTNDIVKLADILGHSSVETTRIYIKSTGTEHMKQLDRMDMIVTECEKTESKKTESENKTKCTTTEKEKRNEEHIGAGTRIEEIKQTNTQDDEIAGGKEKRRENYMDKRSSINDGYREMAEVKGQKVVGRVVKAQGMEMSEFALLNKILVEISEVCAHFGFKK